MSPRLTLQQQQHLNLMTQTIIVNGQSQQILVPNIGMSEWYNIELNYIDPEPEPQSAVFHWSNIFNINNFWFDRVKMVC